MKVAVCIDNSEQSKEAVRQAVDFAESTNKDIVLVHSVEKNINNGNGNGPVQESYDEAIDRSQELLIDIKDFILTDSENVNVSTELLADENKNKADQVIDYLQSEDDIKHVYMGHRSLEERKEELYGSFAKKMMGDATIPITIVS